MLTYVQQFRLESSILDIPGMLPQVTRISLHTKGPDIIDIRFYGSFTGSDKINAEYFEQFILANGATPDNYKKIGFRFFEVDRLFLIRLFSL